MAKIGIYGGTFNPIHNTHIEIAKAAYEQFSLDCLYFLVSGEPPHKNTSNSISPFNRLEMVKLNIAKYERFEIDSREIFRAGKSYSYITLTEYKEEHPDDELYFIMGSDSLIQFCNWVKPEVISENAHILVAPRLGDDMSDILEVLSEYRQRYTGKFDLIQYTPNEISSSEIRDGFYSNVSIRDNIDEVVSDYIEQHNLYNVLYSIEDVNNCTKKVESELKRSRFIHTIGVANTAYSLAIRWNYPAYNAMLAGILHDCAKCMSDKERLDICSKNNIEITDIEARFPHLLHGKVGAYLAKKKYKIDDAQIRHSIAVHTTGCPNMNLLDKIIYISDYIEPGRNKQPRLDMLRKIAFEDLDLCLFMILEDSVGYLSNTPDLIDPTTIETYEFYKKERGI